MSTMKTKEQKPLPKWFDGSIYSEGSMVKNRFGYESIWLEPNELAMYDLIMGAQMMGEYKLMNKGLSWFRSANPEAYMVLLD